MIEDLLNKLFLSDGTGFDGGDSGFDGGDSDFDGGDSDFDGGDSDFDGGDSDFDGEPDGDSENCISFGSKSDEEWEKYYEDKYKNALNQEQWHQDKAKEALARDDISCYKDHMYRAKSWHSDAQGFLRSANIYKNKS